MTTHTRAPEAALARRHAAYIRAAMGELPYKLHPEVRINGARVDAVLESNDEFDAIHYKMSLTQGLVEQCRQTVGIFHRTWAVCGEPVAWNVTQRDHLATLHLLGVGVLWDRDGKFVASTLCVQRNNHDADPAQIIAALLNHSGQGEAGAQHGDVTMESAWLRQVEREAKSGGLIITKLHRWTDSPYRSNQVAMRHLRDAIRERRVAVAIDGQSIVSK